MNDNARVAMGFDDEMEVTEPVAKVTKPKRAPYSTWTVGGVEYKLRLGGADIIKLEERYNRNLLMYLMSDDIPAVADMLTVIQAAMRQYHHGMTFLKVQSLFDSYVDEGGDQNVLFTEVLVPLLSVSGFFTQAQAETLSQETKDLDSNL